MANQILKQAVQNALKWVLVDFSNSTLYNVYQLADGFTDEQYDDMLEVLRQFVTDETGTV